MIVGDLIFSFAVANKCQLKVSSCNSGFKEDFYP